MGGIGGRAPVVAFDDVVHGMAAVYSPTPLELALAEDATYAIQAVVDTLSEVASVTVQLETSCDGRSFTQKNAIAEIAYTTVAGANQTVVLYGFDRGFRPALGLVRVRVQLGSSGGAVSAHVKVYVRQGRARPEVPARIQGCVAWLRADRGVTLDGSGNVSSWRDISESGHDCVQSSSNRRPAYGASTINGHPALHFDASSAGNEKILSLTGSFALTAAHVLLVCKRTVSPPATNARSGIWKLSGQTTNATHVPWTDDVIYEGAGSTARYTCGAPVINLTSPHCYEIRASSSWSSWLNGSQQHNQGVSTFGWSASPELGGDSGGIYHDAHWAEFILYDRVLSGGERDALVAYLNARYALGMT